MGASLGTTAREPRGKSTSVMLRSRLEGNEVGLEEGNDVPCSTRSLMEYTGIKTKIQWNRVGN